MALQRAGTPRRQGLCIYWRQVVLACLRIRLPKGPQVFCCKESPGDQGCDFVCFLYPELASPHSAGRWGGRMLRTKRPRRLACRLRTASIYARPTRRARPVFRLAAQPSRGWAVQPLWGVAPPCQCSPGSRM